MQTLSQIKSNPHQTLRFTDAEFHYICYPPTHKIFDLQSHHILSKRVLNMKTLKGLEAVTDSYPQ